MRWQFDYFGGKCRTQRASCLIFWLMIDDSWVQSHNRSLKCLQLWVVSPWFSTFPSLLTMIWNQLSKWNWAGQLSSMCLYYISTLRIQKQVIIHITGAFELLPWYLFLNSDSLFERATLPLMCFLFKIRCLSDSSSHLCSRQTIPTNYK